MVTNEHDVYCAQPQCRTKIFRKGAAVLALEARSLKGGGMGGVDPGFMHWYDTEDQMAFDNIAFLREQPRPAEEVQAAAAAAAAEEEVREFVLAKEADEGLGTQFEDEDDMRLEELVEGGAAERNAGMQAFVGWTLVEIEGRPVTCCDDVRAASAGAVSVALKFALRKAPHASGSAQPRLLVCAGCERDVIGFAEGGRFSIAAKLVDIGSEAAPNVSVAAASSPAAAELLALLQQEEALKKAAATPEA